VRIGEQSTMEKGKCVGWWRDSAAGAIARGSGASFIALGFRAREGESTMDLWSK
jgi:hypothetical protein